MKLIFHIGAPKTATSSLQFALRGARKRLADEGLAYIPTGNLRNSKFGQRLRLEWPRMLGRRVSRAEVDRFVEQWAGKDADRLLVSEEGYTIYLLHPGRRSWAAQAARTFRILEHFSHYDFRVVLGIRRQDSYLLSCYAHLVRYGRVTEDFDSYWRNRVDLGTMSWLDLVGTFHKEYGSDRLTVLTYESIYEGFPSYFRRFLHHAGALPAERAETIEAAESERNIAMSDPAMKIALIANRHLQDAIPQEKIKDMIKQMRKVLPPQSFPRYAPDTGPVREALAARFAEENRAVAERFVTAPHPRFQFD